MQLSTQSTHKGQTNWEFHLFTEYLPLQSIDTFHYSKTFQANLGINSLTAAAAPLFILMAKLNYSAKHPDLELLQRELIHEIRAFECNAITQDYSPHIILAARYAIVVALDETIQRMPWGNIWQEHYALTPYFYAGQAEPDFFFLFIATLIETDNTPLNVLEFCYLCLNLGFVGIHRPNSEEFTTIQALSNRLFTLVNHRKPAQKNLHMFRRFKHNRLWYNQPKMAWSLLAAASMLICISIYLGFNYIMSTSTKPLYAKLNQIVHETAIS